MGIYDRDYYREDSPSGEGVMGRHSAMVVLLIVNVVVFILWLVANVSASRGMLWFMEANFFVSVEAVRGFRAWTLITYAFSQQDIFHILFNMLFLWIFGKLVEERYGPRNLAFLYVTSALVAAMLYLGLDLAAGKSVPMLGASGAVMGITVVAAFLHPNLKIYIWGIIPIRLKWLAVIFILIDLIGVTGQGESGNTVANSAHLGGALMGFLFYQFNLCPFDRPGRTDFLQRLRGLFRRKPVLRVVPRPTRRQEPPPTGKPDSDTAARVDELLAKIGRDGMQSLSAEEKKFLEEASEKYRK